MYVKCISRKTECEGEHISAVPRGLHFDGLEFGRMKRKYFVVCSKESQRSYKEGKVS
jgi:hypothetical protein